MKKVVASSLTTVRIVVLALTLVLSLSASAQLANSGWAKFRGNAQNQGLSTGSGTTSTLKFFSALANTNASSPVIGLNGIVYVGAGQNIVAIDGQSGATLWTFNTNGIVYSSPAIGADGTVFCSNTNTLFALNGSSGAVKWSYPVPGSVVGSPAIGADGAIYFGDIIQSNGSGHMYGVLPNGAAKWTITIPGIVSSPAIALDGTVYVGSIDFRVYSLDPSTGATKKSFVTSGPVQTAPTIATDGTVYVSSGDGFLYALTSTLTTKWTYFIGGGVTFTPSLLPSPAIGPDGSVYIGTKDGNLYSVSRLGQLNWKFRTSPVNGSTTSIQSSVAVGSDGTVYLGPADSNVYSISPLGLVNWKVSVTNSNAASPALGANGMLYVAATTGIVGFTSVSPASASVSPSVVTGGTGSTGTVTLSSPAPPGGVQLLLSSSSNSAKVPPSVAILGGQTSATFAITTSAVSKSTVITISASLNQAKVSSTLTINPPTLSALATDKPQYVGGNSGQATATISGPAPDSGLTINLSRTGTAVSVPASVTIAGGATTGAFTFQTAGVAASTSATITAILGTTSQRATVTILPATLSGISFALPTVIGPATLGAAVSLNGIAPPSGTAVLLSTTSKKAAVPAKVVVPAGKSSAAFTIQVLSVTSDIVIPVTAKFNTSVASGTFTDTALKIKSLTLNPAIVGGGSPSTGTISLNGPVGVASITVLLKSSSTKATLPATVAITKGKSSADFTISTSIVGTKTDASITASFSAASRAATLTVNPSLLASVSLNPSTVVGGTGATGTVTLTGAAGTGGFIVALSSVSAAATVPSSVTVLAGKSTATFAVQTVGVPTDTTATIQAKAGDVTQTTPLLISAATLSTFTLTPSNIAGGVNATGVLTLSGPAPQQGMTIQLSSDKTAATLPANVTIPAGQTSTSFFVNTSAVDSPVNATITATGDKTLTAQLNIFVAWLSSISVTPSSVRGGNSVTGTVFLSGPAPSTGTLVSLTSSDSSVGLPASVTVPAGQSSADFTVTTSFSFSPITVTLTGQSLAGDVVTTTLSVH